jgi:hypothetical protein
MEHLMTAADPPPNPSGWPVPPDPTKLTQDAVDRLEKALTTYIDGQLAVRDERLRGIDTATNLRLGTVDHLPSQMDEKVARLSDLMDEKFQGVQTQFHDRDTLAERESALNKTALDAAFKAQQEAVAAALKAQQEAAARQDEANQKAIDKSEVATSKTIVTNQELAAAQLAAMARNQDDLKDRVVRMESTKVGANENRTGMYAAIAAIGGILAIVLIIAAALATRAPTVVAP